MVNDADNDVQLINDAVDNNDVMDEAAEPSEQAVHRYGLRSGPREVRLGRDNNMNRYKRE